jgi:hypothetical protein
LDRTDPEWVPVRLAPHSPQWTDPVIAEGNITASGTNGVSYEEFPMTHFSHDQNFHMDLDPKYANLKSTAMTGSMEQEWEIGTFNDGRTDRFPKEFWPWEGDRVWMKGSWVIDCGHFQTKVGPPPDNDVTYFGYRTEIHPPFITAFTRNEPYVFPGETSPSTAAVTYVYLHGRGGNHDTFVGGQDYEFDINLPPCKEGPLLCLQEHRLHSNVIGLPFGGPAPILTANLTANKAHVVIPLKNTPASPDLQYGAIVASKLVRPTGLRS